METANRQSVNSLHERAKLLNEIIIKQKTERQVIDQLTDVVKDKPTLLNDVYFIYLKNSKAYKELDEVEKEDIDYLFCILNDSLFKLQGVS